MYRARSVLSFLLLLLLSGLILGCGGPSKQEAQVAIGKSLSENVPPKLAGYITGGENADLSELTVLGIGKPEGKGQYRAWPVRVRVRGTCDVIMIGLRQIDGVGEYVLSRNEFKEWVARPKSLL